MNASELCLLGAGTFFGTGLLTGVWKYKAIMASPKARAPLYVDVAHRSSLMYGFSAILLHAFVPYSPVSEGKTKWVVGVPLVFFGSAIGTYIVHGVLKDTNNQLQRPHQLGNKQLHGGLIKSYMTVLTVGEIGGFTILFGGFLAKSLFKKTAKNDVDLSGS